MINQTLVENTFVTQLSTLSKPKLIYGYDTLCGWCYGFSKEIEKTIDLLKNDIDFELVNGGLFAGIRGPKMGYMSAHIKRNMQVVTDRTGQKFGKGFLELLDSIHYPYNSTKSSIAIEIIKELKPDKVFEFASGIQRSFFKYGSDIHSDDFYLNLIDTYGLNTDQFIKSLHSDYYEAKANNSFFEIQNYGFKGYPASGLKIGNQFKVLTEGFVTAEKLTHLIQGELNKY